MGLDRDDKAANWLFSRARDPQNAERASGTRIASRSREPSPSHPSRDRRDRGGQAELSNRFRK